MVYEWNLSSYKRWQQESKEFHSIEVKKPVHLKAQKPWSPKRAIPKRK